MTDCNCGTTIYVGHPITGEPHAPTCPWRKGLRRMSSVTIPAEDAATVVETLAEERAARFGLSPP